VHASWLNQIEIYFSIVQRKVLTPNDFVHLVETVAAAITGIGQGAWVDIDYPDGGIAQVAEATLGPDRLVCAAPG
jgi:hypothetical protein